MVDTVREMRGIERASNSVIFIQEMKGRVERIVSAVPHLEVEVIQASANRVLE